MVGTRKDIYQTNFDRLVKLGICDEAGVIRPDGKSESKPYMDLVLEAVPHYSFRHSSSEAIYISLAHYFKQNGDLCSDPEMVLIIHPSLKSVEAFSYQLAIPAVYQEVYPNADQVHLKFKKQQNSFLRTWLTNLIEQDHGVCWIDR